jgi:hypothetical protein
MPYAASFVPGGVGHQPVVAPATGNAGLARRAAMYRTEEVEASGYPGLSLGWKNPETFTLLSVTISGNGQQSHVCHTGSNPLEVGPPSLAQLAFEYDLGPGATYRPPSRPIRWAGRILDEPRILLNAPKG